MDVVHQIQHVLVLAALCLKTFPDLCLTSQLRHVDFPTVFAETLLHAIYNTLLGNHLQFTAALIIMEVSCVAPVYDPDYHACNMALSWLGRRSLLLPDILRGWVRSLVWEVPPFVVQTVLELKRCITMGVFRSMWVIFYEQVGFPDYQLIVKKSLIFIFVKFCLGAPPCLINVYWIFVIAYEYVSRFPKKTCHDLLLLSAISLLCVATVDWMEGYRMPSLMYIFVSYVIYFYWLLSMHMLF